MDHDVQEIEVPRRAVGRVGPDMADGALQSQLVAIPGLAKPIDKAPARSA